MPFPVFNSVLYCNNSDNKCQWSSGDNGTGVLELRKKLKEDEEQEIGVGERTELLIKVLCARATEIRLEKKETQHSASFVRSSPLG